VPEFVRKEVLIINSSLSVCDPGDIFQTIDSVVQDNIYCSVISLSAQLNVLNQLTLRTNGTFSLAKEKDDFSDII
jgi:transcription initiation factor TFIIH subunit 2